MDTALCTVAPASLPKTARQHLLRLPPPTGSCDSDLGPLRLNCADAPSPIAVSPLGKALTANSETVGSRSHSLRHDFNVSDQDSWGRPTHSDAGGDRARQPGAG